MEPKHTPRPAEHTAPQTGLFDATIWYVAGGVLLLVLAGGLVIAAKHEKK
ncbi:LPXTG cell wall anchor domain-containing protein [Mediterraneibacter gnavus]